jgi:hypothetical protein
MQRNLRMLVGFAMDLSGSMRESINNNSGSNMSRLESFRQSLKTLASDARRLAAQVKEAQAQSDVRLFVYGFGLRQGRVCDLLSLMRAAGDVVSQDEIESLKRRYVREIEARYAGYSGLGGLARQFGFGGLVDVAEREARRNAEQEVRTRIETEIARRLRDRLQALGDTTVTPEELVELWSGSAERIEGAEAFIYGDTPMCEALELVAARFSRELAASPAGTEAILFLLSDGAPTDGNPLPVAQRLKAMGVTIVSCLITNRDIAEPKQLFSRSEGHWQAEPRLMFDMASRLPVPSPFADYLEQQQWKLPPRARLFVQANHSQVVEEFARVVLSPMSEQPGGQETFADEVFPQQ